ncbi:MAG TPA: hypothetical protein VEV38_05420, partial [Candidatus Eremiobacteraceae bacterium]|nr:hypothetical protein [Candidatus Eremiobacteraceae bacterium]
MKMIKRRLMLATLVVMMPLGVLGASLGPAAAASATTASTTATAAPSSAPTFKPPVLKMSRIYVPQIKETVLIIWVSQEPGVDFPVEADTVFSHIVHSLRNSNIQVCLVRTTLTQTSTNALGAV